MVNKSKAAIVTSTILGKIASIIGYTLGLFALVFIIIVIEGGWVDFFDVFTILLFAVPAVLLIIRGRRIKHRVRRFRKYVSLISTQNMTSIDSIAANTDRTADFVRADLQKMIAKRFFTNASINVVANEIVIGGQSASTPVASISTQAPTVAQVEIESFSCSGCGASGTKQKGTSSTCEYCGSAVV